MRGKAGAIAALAAAATLCAQPALGSGGPEPRALYIDSKGGTAPERARHYRGRLGIVLRTAGDGLLFADWRLLHNQRVGEEAGAALAIPCCDTLREYDPDGGSYAWLRAREAVPGVPASEFWISTDRPGDDYRSVPNCFNDAFDLATETLRNRIAAHGVRSPAVKAWLLTQDNVFAACSREGVTLPALPANAPAWLRADRAYQEAAFALYDNRFAEAAQRFGVISRDRASPWQPKALYLQLRATLRETQARPTAQGFADARTLIATLAAASEGTFGRQEVVKLLGVLDYRQRPAEYLRELDGALSGETPPERVAPMLKDYLSLADSRGRRPQPAEWIRVLQWDDRAPALARALGHWRSTGDRAWLLAALSIAEPGDAATPALLKASVQIPEAAPGALGAAFHRLRLTMASADEAETRRRLDSLLARTDLTLGERNILTAARTQVASDLHDLARLSVRRAYCAAPEAECGDDDFRWIEGAARVGDHWVGIGADAAALIDRLPLAQRLIVSRDRALPRDIRLDLALTGFARAVQLENRSLIDAFARDLTALLPQLGADWQAIASTRPAPAKRFAIAVALAKLPGLRTDLIGFTRPTGTIREFRGYWTQFRILPPAVRPAQSGFRGAKAYLNDGWNEGPAVEDLTCQNKCGLGAFPLHAPAFVAAGEAEARRERAAFGTEPYYNGGNGEMVEADAPIPTLWETALHHARANPRDPRVPELLYRLIRVSRWGGESNGLGKRSFQLLHARYPGTVWAKRSPFWYA
ncbi:MAG TPA: hypothetical protein VGB65_01335 [Allosphingosinicella sp.]|jgi:hypothetical protein